jgi:hypothetical protein
LITLPVFATGLGLAIFDATYFVWFASELVGAVLVPRLRGRGATRVRRDRGSTALILLSVSSKITGLLTTVRTGGCDIRRILGS